MKAVKIENCSFCGSEKSTERSIVRPEKPPIEQNVLSAVAVNS